MLETNPMQQQPITVFPTEIVESTKVSEEAATPVVKRNRRGFASMDPAKQREIASKGGKAAHNKGTAHQFTTEEARVAGRKGGQARSRRLAG